MEFLSAVNNVATVPSLILIVAIFVLLFREVKKSNDRLEADFRAHEKSVSSAISAIKAEIKEQLKAERDQQAARDKKQDDLLERLNARINEMERDYADKAYVQEAVGGWRTDMRDLGNRMDNIYMKVVEVSNGKK
jgi:septal ring factor EnvC (AmiA/AmiB activator)